MSFALCSHIVFVEHKMSQRAQLSRIDGHVVIECLLAKKVGRVQTQHNPDGFGARHIRQMDGSLNRIIWTPLLIFCALKST